MFVCNGNAQASTLCLDKLKRKKEKMKEEVRDVLDWKVPMLVYETVDEGDKAAGKEGAVLAEANNNLLYRGTYNDARELIQDIVEELTGVEPLRGPTGKKDTSGADITEVTESEKKYTARALAQAAADGKVVSKEQIQKLIDDRARGYTFTNDKGEKIEVPALAADISHRVRTAPKPKKLSAEFLATAQSALSAGKQNALIALFKRDLGEDVVLTGDTAKDAETLGWALKRHISWRQQQMLAAYTQVS